MQKSFRRKIIKERRLTNPPKHRHKLQISNLTLHKLDWLEWITIGVSVWFIFSPKPYGTLLGLLLVIPILGLIINGLNKPSIASLVEISADKDGNPKYDVADFIDVAAWAILLRVLIDFEFESFYSMIIPGTVACAMIIGILMLTHKLIETSNQSKWWIYSSLIFNIVLYSYAGTYAANCAYDNSTPTIYRTEVLDKEIRTGRRGRKSYYIQVAPWGHHYDKENIQISRGHYNEVVIGDTVNIDLKKGLFNIPWYFVERN